MLNRFVVALVCLLTSFTFTACMKKNGGPAASSESAPIEGVEKVKPAPGTGNVQGKVLYNGAPVENIEQRIDVGAGFQLGDLALGGGEVAPQPLDFGHQPVGRGQRQIAVVRMVGGVASQLRPFAENGESPFKRNAI